MDKLSNEQPPDLSPQGQKARVSCLSPITAGRRLLVSHSQAQRDEAAGFSKGRAHEETSVGQQGWEYHFHTQFTVAPPHPGARRAVQELGTLSWGSHLSIGKSCLRAALLGLPSGEETPLGLAEGIMGPGFHCHQDKHNQPSFCSQGRGGGEDQPTRSTHFLTLP